jgi:ABC-type dipeptide/oligopeptide/nickel transport system ATPase component
MKKIGTAPRLHCAVLVLHKDRVVEAGPPGPVLQHPRHPYTKLLADGRITNEAALWREIDAMHRRRQSYVALHQKAIQLRTTPIRKLCGTEGRQRRRSLTA